MDTSLGQIQLFAFNFIPKKWTRCDGKILQISQHAALFERLGTTYGGDGQTSFALPNLVGKEPIPGSAYFIYVESIVAEDARRQFIREIRAIDRDTMPPACVMYRPETRVASEKLYGVDASSSNAWVQVKSLPMEYRSDTPITYDTWGPIPLGEVSSQHPDKLFVGFQMLKQPEYYLYEWGLSSRPLLTSSQDMVFRVKPARGLVVDDPHWSMVWYYIDAKDYQAFVDEGS
ncbi:tail fiber protein [Accumulibacter sp.]|uniref:phage tail protein n=1 Tax=Accumulibacter sp. TaxID=2053492 RepID=UPI0028C4A703|nr:tail fiber protein [Accumulibacter sp.]